jgi:hypothetical protein
MENSTVSFIPASKIFDNYPEVWDMFQDTFRFSFGDANHTLYTVYTVLRHGVELIDRDNFIRESDKNQTEAVITLLQSLDPKTFIDMES